MDAESDVIGSKIKWITLSCSAVAPVLATLSLPAKSTKLSFKRCKMCF